MNTSIKAIDLFCGVGGLSFGLKKANIPVVAGVDLDGSCKYAYEENVKTEFYEYDVSQLDSDWLFEKFGKSEKQINILVGCAPCQPFSTHSNKNKNRSESEKWNLISHFGRLISEVQPDVVSMENVPNLSNQDIFKDFVRNLKLNGYYVRYSNVYCPDYGIPQKRRRLVLFASKFGYVDLIPKTHSPKNYVTTKDAIGTLPPIKAGESSPEDPLHRAWRLNDINLKRIQASRPNGTWLDWDEELRLNCHKKESGSSYSSVYGRMTWDQPSPTITTQFYNYGTGRFGHPTQDRALSIREAAILQSFPSDYKFYQDINTISLSKIGVHIGNAVPVDLGFVIGKSILHHLEFYGK